MSKKQLLEETTIRKFMKLANLEPLSDRFIKEELGYTEEEEDMGAPEDDALAGPKDMGAEMGAEMGADDGMGDEGDLDIDLDDSGAGGDMDISPEVAKKVVQAVMDALGVEGTVEDDEDMGDGDDAGEMDDFDGDDEAGEEFDGEEEGEEDEEEPAEEDEAELNEEDVSEGDEVEESRLSEDELVENVLKRVTARLIAEAKASKNKKSGVKSKMDEKKREVKGKKVAEENQKKLDEEKHTVTHKKSNPLLTKGKNKYKAFEGEDQHLTKFNKSGKATPGSHKMSPLKTTKKHIVSHDKGVDKMSSKGGNKK